MYRPKHFDEPHFERLHEFVREQPFGTIVSQGEAGLEASHVPFLIDAVPDSPGRLFGHLARANPQWRAFDGEAECLTVFQGPHAYVSPAWMESASNVPTWNYVAVHAYGRPEVIEDPDRVRAGIERLVATSEAFRSSPWATGKAPADFIDGLLRGIVAFDLPIDRIEGKWKLSQNKSEADRRGIIRGLEAEGGEASSDLARVMRDRLGRFRS